VKENEGNLNASEEVIGVNPEIGFFAALLSSRENQKYLRIIPSEYFIAYRNIFKFIRKFWEEYNNLPTKNILLQEVGIELPKNIAEPIDYYVDVLKRSYLRRELIHLLKSVEGTLEDPQEAYDLIREKIDKINVAVDASVTTLSEVDDIIDWYKRRDHPKYRGLTFGWEIVDIYLQAIEPSEFWLISSDTGIGKTWMCCYLLNLWGIENNKRVLFVTSEMSERHIRTRMHALSSRVSWNRFRAGTLNDEEKKRWQDTMEIFKKKGDNVKILQPALIEGGISVSGISSEVEIIQPDVVIIDGLYLLKDDWGEKTGSWQAIKNIAYQIKRDANKFNIPYITTSQMGRTGEQGKQTKRDIMYSYSLVQICDMALEIWRDEDMIENKEMRIKILKARDREPTLEVKVRWDLDKMDFRCLSVDSEEGISL